MVWVVYLRAVLVRRALLPAVAAAVTSRALQATRAPVLTVGPPAEKPSPSKAGTVRAAPRGAAAGRAAATNAAQRGPTRTPSSRRAAAATSAQTSVLRGPRQAMA